MMRSNYLRGVMWFVLVSVVSALNDTLIKMTGLRLSGIQVSFFRFFFSCLTLLPFMIVGGRERFKTVHWRIHGVRSLFLFLAMAPWCYGVIALPLSLVTTLSFTTPLFVLLLSFLFLRESLGWHRVLATCLGFCGILVSVQPTLLLDGSVFLLIGSTILFASLDILNKKLLIQNETLLSMLFFSALGTTLLSFPFALLDWTTPSVFELVTLFFLGIGANLILYFLLKAFSFCDLSSLQPFRYVELLFSSMAGFFLFGVFPTWSTLLGACLIIPATFYVALYEMRTPRIETSDV